MPKRGERKGDRTRGIGEGVEKRYSRGITNGHRESRTKEDYIYRPIQIIPKNCNISYYSNIVVTLMA
jgi:hypothetical protein